MLRKQGELGSLFRCRAGASTSGSVNSFFSPRILPQKRGGSPFLSRANVVAKQAIVETQVEFSVADDRVGPDVFSFRELEAANRFKAALRWPL